jgi:hypothetical protein
MKVVLIPGWHENVDQMRVLVDGRNGKPGLKAFGFDCFLIPEGRGGLDSRIERFGTVLDELKRNEPGAFPIATFGYSAGGLISRGFLRAHPERAGEISSVFQLAAPNGGVAIENVALTLRALRIPVDAVEDMKSDSRFIAWLNGSSGRFEPAGKNTQRWCFDSAPVVGPAGVRFMNVAGVLPRDRSSDGVVSVASATLDGLIESDIIEDSTATHLNLSGAWNPLTLLFRGWRANDKLWPAVVKRAAAFFTAS